jgi:hypothetical protein
MGVYIVYRALYNPKAALSAIGMIVYAILAIALWIRESIATRLSFSFARKAFPKYNSRLSLASRF